MARLIDLIGKTKGQPALELTQPAPSASPDVSALRRDALYPPDDPRVRKAAAAHHDAVSSVLNLLEKVSRKSHDWELQDCLTIVSNLNHILQENPRFLIGVCRSSRDDFDASRHHDMLAYHAVDCCVAMLCLFHSAAEPEERVYLGGLAGLVQNFGMALIPPEIVAKRGKLTPHEFRQVRDHPVLGARIPQIAEMPELAEIVSQSHERLDGSGYPRGLKGDNIHPVALYLHGVDVFEALTHPRTYRHTETAYNAMKVINMVRASVLNTGVVRSLISFFTVYPIGSLVELNTRERGKVVDTNPGELLRPVVAALVDTSGKPYPQPAVIDLGTLSHLYIVRVIDDENVEALGAGVF